MDEAKRLARANPNVTMPTYPVRLNQEELEAVGRRRWSHTHRKGSQIAMVVMTLTVGYVIMTIGQLRGPLGQWLILGLVVPLGVLMVVGYKEGRAASRAAREFAEKVKGGRP